jgi:signal transduction histidine kinase
MAPHYDPTLVVVSILIAIMSSYVALDLTGRLSTSSSDERWVWWLGGSIAMGVGIWSMHFVGMLAFHLPVQARYDGALVLLSILVAVAASALALFVASQSTLPIPVLAASSVFMGSAISGMHYIGMAAMRLPAVVTWRPNLVAASIMIAVAASFVALLLAFRLRHEGTGLLRKLRLWAAVVMGVAIAGMHYTGMAAARFTPAPMAPEIASLSLHTGAMSIAVTISTVVILSVALASAAFSERTRLLAREQQARREAEAANRLKDEFLATLSHELRTPLNVIVGRSFMLRSIAHDAAQVIQTADTIARNGEALSYMLEDLLDVARMTVGGAQLEWQAVDLPALLESAASGVRPGAEAKGVLLAVAAVPRVPFVMGDPIRLQQVVWNLLTNALKFTPTGGQIHANVRQEGHHVVLTVTDTGQGIDPAFLPHVFDMFRQAEPTRTRTYGGLGIGLSIVRRLVEQHGGQVSLASAGVGRGTTVTVSLPFQPQVVVENRATVSPVASTPSGTPSTT